jgi:hypothetical protein
MISIAINSHISSYNKCAIPLIKNLIDIQIPINKIYCFIGGCQKEDNYIDQCRVYKTNHNSYDHTSYIEIVNKNIESEYWFIMHDTCHVLPNFKKGHIKLGYDMVSILEEAWWNMGLFDYEFLQDNKSYINQLKNCNKTQAILSERFIKRFSENTSYYEKEKDVIDKLPSDVYSDNILRKSMIFENLGLIKHQSYYPNSNLLKEISKNDN